MNNYIAEPKSHSRSSNKVKPLAAILKLVFSRNLLQRPILSNQYNHYPVNVKFAYIPLRFSGSKIYI